MRAAAASWAALALALAVGAPAGPAQAAGPPQVGAQWTANVSITNAALRAEVNPEGLPTAYHFQYITEVAYRANLAAAKDPFDGAARAPALDAGIGSGSAFVTAAQALAVSTLAPDTDYRFRVRASNSAGPAAGAALPFRTAAFFSGTTLPDNRGWELVSPVDKGGGEIGGPGESFGGGLIRAAAAGGTLTYSSTSAFGEAPPGAPPVSQYRAVRGSGGWTSANISAPTSAGAFGPEPDGAPYRLAAPDLSRYAMSDGQRYSLRGELGQALALVPELPDLHLVGASPGLEHLILADAGGLHRYSGTGLTPVGVLPGQSTPEPGAELAAPAGAVSADGQRVYFTFAGDLYLREGATTHQLDAALGGGGSFEAASADGALVFLSKDEHLYRRAAPSTALTDLTPDGGLRGVLGVSADGTAAYYQDAEGLKRWSAGETRTIAPGGGAAHPSSWPPATGSARVTSSGSHLAFLSAEPLSDYDNRQAPGAGSSCDESGAQTQQPCARAYLYDAAAETLTCASCNPSAERPLGPTSIPAAQRNGTTLAHKPRALSDDGRRLFFETTDALVAQDTSTQPDVYQWQAPGKGSCEREGGCVALISRGRSGAGGSFLDASASGDQAFFLTADSLVSQDSGFADVYAATVGGGFPEPPRPLDCNGDSCQPLEPAPEDPTPASVVPSPGNPPLRFSEQRRRCRPGAVRKGGRCVPRRALARRACAKRRGKARRRCLRIQLRRLAAAPRRSRAGAASRPARPRSDRARAPKGAP